MGVSRCKWRREEWRPGLLMGAWEHRYTGGFCVRAAGGTRVGFFFWLAPSCPRGKGTEMKYHVPVLRGGGDKDANFGAATPRAHTGQSGADDAGLRRGCEAL
ncbi:hypothetical protein BN1723_010827, partial [Verticillium longisporum]